MVEYIRDHEVVWQANAGGGLGVLATGTLNCYPGFDPIMDEKYGQIIAISHDDESSFSGILFYDALTGENDLSLWLGDSSQSIQQLVLLYDVPISNGVGDFILYTASGPLNGAEGDGVAFYVAKREGEIVTEIYRGMLTATNSETQSISYMSHISVISPIQGADGCVFLHFLADFGSENDVPVATSLYTFLPPDLDPERRMSCLEQLAELIPK